MGHFFDILGPVIYRLLQITPRHHPLDQLSCPRELQSPPPHQPITPPRGLPGFTEQLAPEAVVWPLGQWEVVVPDMVLKEEEVPWPAQPLLTTTGELER